MGLDMYLSANGEEIGYWRKANSIHSWFINNCANGTDDCEPVIVSRESLESLLHTVKQVLENHSLASSLLPTQSGFFFGNTDYNTWYFDDLVQTRQILENALAMPAGTNFVYQASW